MSAVFCHERSGADRHAKNVALPYGVQASETADRVNERAFPFPGEGSAFVRRFIGVCGSLGADKLGGLSETGIPLPVFKGIGHGLVQSLVEVESFPEVGRCLPR